MITVQQTFKLYEIINRYFKNDTDSRELVSEIEQVMDSKVEIKMNDYATKKDLLELRFDLKRDITVLRSDMEKCFREQLKWIIVLILGSMSVTITVVKLL